MTATLPETGPETLAADALPADTLVAPDLPVTDAPDAGEPTSTPPSAATPSVTLIAVSALLSALAAAFMVGGLLKQPYLARGFAAAGALAGATMAWSSFRTRSTTVVQYLLLPGSLIAGAVAISSSASSGAKSLGNLLHDVVGGGGLLQTPVPFEPGWRFLLVTVFSLVTGAGVCLAVGLGKPRLALVVPLPVTIGGSLLQPTGTGSTAGVVALLLTITALGAGYGADVASATGTVDARFELRRMRKAIALMLVVSVALIGLSRFDLLFPDTSKNHVYPPQKPPHSPLEPDHVVFTVASKSPGPWRLGVLDVYDGTGFLLPPYDANRKSKLAGGAVPDAPSGTGDVTTIKIGSIKGRSLPVPYGIQKLTASGTAYVDPRLDVAVLDSSVPDGFNYQVTAASLPTAAQMNAVPVADPTMLQQFGPASVPPPPDAVQALLRQAPRQIFDRLQFLRDKLYATVAAKGEGTPVDILPTRVAQMLHAGATASPFEITAAEALLARWAGVPARLGYGYYGGTSVQSGRELHPRDGAAWLEVYFRGYGWVPLVGVPPHAVSSLDLKDKKDAPSTPSDQLTMTVFILHKTTSQVYLFQIARYIAELLLLIAAALALVWFSWPVLCKWRRHRSRTAWALAHGPVGSVQVAYARLRDYCIDLNIADRCAPPLAFRDAFVPDAQHDELAWLTSRALWGDLQRGLRTEDAEAAETMAAALVRRIASEQDGMNRLLAWVSRTSLREPYDLAIPNVWPRLHLPRVRVRRIRLRLPFVRRLASGAVPSLVLVLVGLLTLSGCGTATAVPGKRLVYPDRLVPTQLLGLQVRREPKAELAYRKATDSQMTSGRVWTLRDGDAIEGSIQISLLKPGVDTSQADVRSKIESGIGGLFVPFRVGSARLDTTVKPELRLFVYFPPQANVMELILLRKGFSQPYDTITALLLYQHGIDTAQTLPPGASITFDSSGLPTGAVPPLNDTPGVPGQPVPSGSPAGTPNPGQTPNQILSPSRSPSPSPSSAATATPTTTPTARFGGTR